MVYLVSSGTFQCTEYLAIWNDGVVEPTYNDKLKIWQFVYTNGESCGGLQMIFVVDWYCDRNATTPSIVRAEQSGECVYTMDVNSSLACT